MGRIGVAAKRIERNDEERCEGLNWGVCFFPAWLASATSGVLIVFLGKIQRETGKWVKMGIVRGEMGRLPCQGFRVASFFWVWRHTLRTLLCRIIIY